MSRDNLASAIEHHDSIKTVKVRFCRISQSTLSCIPLNSLHVTGAKHPLDQFSENIIRLFKFWDLDERAKEKQVPYLTLSAVELRGNRNAPSPIHSMSIIDQKSPAAYTLPEQLQYNLKRINLLHVEFRGVAMSFPDNVQSLVMVGVKMTSEAWTETLTALPVHLEQLTLQEIEVSDTNVDNLFPLNQAVSDQLITKVFMHTLRNIPQNLKLLHLAQSAVIEDINLTLLRSLKFLWLERITMKASSWMRVFDGIKDMPWKPFFNDCRMDHFDDSDKARIESIPGYRESMLRNHKGK